MINKLKVKKIYGKVKKNLKDLAIHSIKISYITILVISICQVML